MSLPDNPKDPKAEREAFHKAVDDHHPERLDPAKVKAANAKEAARLFRMIRNSKR